jgi:hypothetical protein
MQRILPARQQYGCISLLLLALCILVYGYLTESIAHFKTAAIITLSGGCLFLISDIIQYGILFHGPAGFAIPLGVPAILGTRWWTYRREFPDT